MGKNKNKVDGFVLAHVKRHKKCQVLLIQYGLGKGMEKIRKKLIIDEEFKKFAKYEIEKAKSLEQILYNILDEFLHKYRMYHNSNDFISILDIQIWVLYRILPRFSWYGFQTIFLDNIFFRNMSFFKI